MSNEAVEKSGKNVFVKVRRPIEIGAEVESHDSPFEDGSNIMETVIECHPDYDDVTHCNIYSRGKTRLGRLCSNHADISIEHPDYGFFRNLEGLWYYLRTGMKHEGLRVLSAYDAREFGKKQEKEWNPNFNREFKIGIVSKVKASEEIRQLLTSSSLPFVHYYVYGKSPDVRVIVPKGHEWQMLMWERMRNAVKQNRSLDDIIESLRHQPKRLQ